MLASRGMGAIAPSKMPVAKRKARRDDTAFKQFKEGGGVNAAGNYTKPSLRKRIVSQVKAAATQGTGKNGPYRGYGCSLPMKMKSEQCKMVWMVLDQNGKWSFRDEDADLIAG